MVVGDGGGSFLGSGPLISCSSAAICSSSKAQARLGFARSFGDGWLSSATFI